MWIRSFVRFDSTFGVKFVHVYVCMYEIIWNGTRIFRMNHIGDFRFLITVNIEILKQAVRVVDAYSWATVETNFLQFCIYMEHT